MSAVITSRGVGASSSSATSFTLFPGSNLAAGAMAVLCVAVDNAGTSGGALATFAVSDTKGNTWTRRQSPLYDPAGVSAGVEGAIFTSPQDKGALITSDVLTVSFGSTTVSQKGWTLTEVASSIGGTIDYVTGGVNAGAGTGTPTVNTASIPTGDIVIGALFAEQQTTSLTGDADTSNGSWSTAAIAGVDSGTTATSIAVLSQTKIVTGQGTQTFNPTLTSADCILAWIQLTEVQPVKGVAADRTFGTPRVAGGGVAPNVPAGLRNEIGRPGPALRALQRFVGLNRYERPGQASPESSVTGSPWHYYAQQSRQAH